MDKYVVDASVAVALVLPDEPYYSHASALFEGFAKEKLELVTVPLFIFEVCNALWKAVQRGRIEFPAAVEAARRIAELRIPSRAVSIEAMLDIAHEHKRTAYDAAYLALALQEKAPLVTADRRLYNALEGRFELIRWIESAA